MFGHVESLKKVYSNIDTLETLAESRPLSDSESHLPIMLCADKVIWSSRCKSILSEAQIS